MIIIDEPAYIKDGYVVINYNGITIKQRVKQTKGRGVSDADKLTKLNFYHEDIIRIILKPEYASMEGTYLRKLIKDKYISEGKKFTENNWMRPISELFRKGILLHNGKHGNSIIYKIDKSKAHEALRTGLFEQGSNYDISLEKIKEHTKMLLEGAFFPTVLDG